MDTSREPLLDTYLQHYAEEEKILGAVVPPIFQNSLFVFEDFESFSNSVPNPVHGKPYVYSRTANPSMHIVEQKLAYLEHTDRAKVFGSGMGAISCAIMSCISGGSHVVAVDTSYSNTRQMLEQYLPRFGVETTFVVGDSPEEVISAVRPETTLIYLESPSTFLFKLQDLETITRFAREKGIKTIIDNSYATPIFQTPADFGVDLIVHSATKYLGGHSDITAGVVCGPREHMEGLLQNEVLLYGSALAPFPAWLLLRGMRTLHLRMKQHQIAGNQVAQWLLKSPFVQMVNHVGLECYPQRELYLKQMRGSGGLLSFEPRFQSKEQISRFMNALKLFQMGVSWGGFESLCVSLFIKPMTFDEQRWVVRVYCGLEDPTDMIADLQQAFEQAG
jgi:cystathionine beta-lyase/cystathionine gamma-synthase